MKKNLVIAIALLLLSCTCMTSCNVLQLGGALLSMIPPPERNDFDEEWIIGKSYDEVVAEYGEYHHRTITWRGKYEIYYLKREKHVGPLGTDPEIYYVIYFKDDIAYAASEELGGKGG